MLNFGASKPRVKGGGLGPQGPLWIDACRTTTTSRLVG